MDDFTRNVMRDVRGDRGAWRELPLWVWPVAIALGTGAVYLGALRWRALFVILSME